MRCKFCGNDFEYEQMSEHEKKNVRFYGDDVLCSENCLYNVLHYQDFFTQLDEKPISQEPSV